MLDSIWFHIVLLLSAYIGMECVAWFTHKYIMHGFLWHVHKDHHLPTKQSFFQKNDFFFILFAIPGIVNICVGIYYHFNAFFWIGLGIALYGFTYFLIHDVFIHQRFRIFRNADRFFYFRAIRKAHQKHHSNVHKEKGECFGLLWMPLTYLKESIQSSKRAI